MPLGSKDFHSYALVIGESLIDIVSRPDDAARGTAAAEHVGGSPCNVAFGLARLGRPVQFATQFADDRYGNMIRKHLESSHVGMDFVAPLSKTSTAKAIIDETGAAKYEFDIHWSLPPVVLEKPPMLMHTGSIAAFLEPGADAVATTIAEAQCAVTFDPNVRPNLITDAARARARIDSFVAAADVVKASDEDLAWYAPEASADDVVRDWLARGPSMVVVTKGKDGAFGVCRGGEVQVRPPKVEVVDTVGAGDAFMTGILDSIWERGLLGGDLSRVSKDDLEGVLTDAAVVSALTVSKAGADLPTRETRDAFVAQR